MLLDQQLLQIRQRLPLLAAPQSSAQTCGAAVLLTLIPTGEGLEVLFTRRAEHLSEHAGEVSFPGGKYENSDTDLLDTALRETYEEVGISPQSVECLGALPIRQAKSSTRVSPYVGLVPEDIVLLPSADEIASVFRVPLSYFLQDNRQRTDIFQRHGREWVVPAYHYQGYEIWGFTSGILTDFLNAVFDAGINGDHPAPKKYWS